MVFKKILCVSNLSTISRNAEYFAIKFSHIFNSKLTILSCGEYYSHVPNNYFDENAIQPINDNIDNINYIKNIEQKKKETIDYFNKIQNNLGLYLNENIVYEIKLENEVTATMDHIEEKGAEYDLIIVGKEHNTHWERLLFGSPAKEIFDGTKINTLLIPCGEEWKSWIPTGILVCSSLHQAKENAELIGAHIADKFATSLTIMHIINENARQFINNFTHIFPLDYIPPQNEIESNDEMINLTQQRIDEIIKDLKEKTTLQNIKSHVEIGQVTESVIQYLEREPKNNLLIIGSRGENAIKRFFLGNNTDVIEKSCRVPILIVFYPNE